MILYRIREPKDIKSLSLKELEELAAEIRKIIIDTVSTTGGHLASSLGIVELTLALHYVFDLPHDIIIWDVGHQAYTHKILTGRKESFGTLRTLGGISGFPKIEESSCDAFGTGHSSTSISAALGISTAHCLLNLDRRVIAIIGDGSLTGGQAFEALNHAGHIQKNIIVIINDNEMSISPNVGALSSFLSRKLSTKFIIRLKKEIEIFLRSFPTIGEDLVKIAKKAEDAIKGFMTPGMLFEAMNFQYFGPISGHRLDLLIETLTNIKSIPAPIVLHVLTTKGKGYPPAEKNPSKFHGVGPFNKRTGKSSDPEPEKLTYTQAFSRALIKCAEQNPKIVAITAAMAEGTGLSEFAEKFPLRFFDVGIAEQHAVTFAAGLATHGFIPVVAIYSTFLQRAYDQVIHDVALQKLPVIFAIDRGGIVGEDGPTHQGMFDISYLRNIPSIILMGPKDENELVRMFYTAVNECEHGRSVPIAIRYPRGKGYGVSIDDDPSPIAIGKAEILAEGKDITILAFGSTVIPSLNAARQLQKRGVSATVINARFAKPIDVETIASSVMKTGKLLTVEEGILSGGFGSAVVESLEGVLSPFPLIKRLGIDDAFVEQGPIEIIRDRYNLSSRGIFETALDLLTERETRSLQHREDK